ncbi:MAG: hypothetical protein ACE5EG_00245 [Thermoanaerobaculia bacterium]
MWPASVLFSLCLVLSIGAALSAKTELEAPREQLFFQDLAWSPDGSWIAFSRYSGGPEYLPENWGVAIARPDGSAQETIAENAMWVSWSPDGGRLAFSSPREGSWDLYAVDRDGSDLIRLTTHEADERAPSWSPTGREIAFTSDRDGDSEVYVLTLDEGRVRRLTHDPAPDHNPSWSPNGNGLVFYRAVEGGSADQVYWVSADGTEERQVTRDSDLNTFPAFLDDRRVTFSKRFEGSGEERLVVLDTESSAQRLVGPEGAFFGRWSPDGSEILFIAGEWPKASVYSMDSDGSGVRKVLN